MNCHLNSGLRLAILLFWGNPYSGISQRIVNCSVSVARWAVLIDRPGFLTWLKLRWALLLLPPVCSRSVPAHLAPRPTSGWEPGSRCRPIGKPSPSRPTWWWLKAFWALLFIGIGVYFGHDEASLIRANWELTNIFSPTTPSESPRQGTWLTRSDLRPQKEVTLLWVLVKQVEPSCTRC